MEIEKLSDKVPTPRRATKYSACYDIGFYPASDDHFVTYFDDENDSGDLGINKNGEIVIPPGARAIVPTGLRLKIPGGHHVKVYSRSSMALKRGLVLVNSIGIIDEDYEDPLYMLLHNVTKVDVTLKIGERIGQIELCQTTPITFYKDDGDEENDANAPNRKGGLGSTGK